MTDFLNDANLQGYWRLEADGKDETANGYNMTAGGSPSFISAKFGNGVSLVSSNSQRLITSGATNLRITGSQTWGCWYKPGAISDVGVAMGIGNINASQWGCLKIASSGKPEFTLIGFSPNSAGSGATTTATVGNWYFLCGVVDTNAGTISVWINDEKVTTTGVVNSFLVDSSCELALGTLGAFTGWGYNEGIIDDAFIFDRALTDEEVAELYNGGTGKELGGGGGTNTQINIGDEFKDIESMQINIGDTWKDVNSVSINVGDTWKNVF